LVRLLLNEPRALLRAKNVDIAKDMVAQAFGIRSLVNA